MSEEQRAGEVTEARGDGWLRDWPMLLGLVVSAALVFASTLLAGVASDGGEKSSPAARSVNELAGETPAAADAAAAPEGERRARRRHRRATPNARKQPKKVARRPETGPDAPAASSPSTPSAPGRRSPGGGPRKPFHAPIVTMPGTSASATVHGVAFSFSAPTHEPVVGRAWTMKATATDRGKPASGSVKVNAMFNGEVVGSIDKGRISNGRYRHTIKWPAKAVGHELTVQISLEVDHQFQTFLYKVQVQAK